MAMALEPCKAEEILTAASGALVPMATTVSPIMIGGIHMRIARLDAPSTK